MLTVLNSRITEKERVSRAELEKLLTDVAVGDREAFAGLYRWTRGPVYALALSILHNVQEAQDVTQDVFVRVWEKAPEYQSRGAAMAWILTITRNLALAALRREERRAELSPEEWDAIPAQAPEVTSEDRQILQDALSKLGEEERRAVLLHAVSGLKHREIAALLELPLATVLSKYHRGLKKLRNQLEGGEPR